MAANAKGVTRIVGISVPKIASGAISEGNIVELVTDQETVRKTQSANSIIAYGVALADAADGDTIEVQLTGVAAVLSMTGITYTIGDNVVTGVTAGQTKTIDGNGPQVVIGQIERTQITTAAQLIPVRLMFAIDG